MAPDETSQYVPEAPCFETRRAQRRSERKFNRRSSWRPTLNLTSMIDVVFLLLVYFMVATEFKQAEVIERLDLPNRLGAGVADPFEVPDHPVVITVTSQDTDSRRATVEAGFTIGVEGSFPQPTTPEVLTMLLSERRMGGAGGRGLWPEDHPIVLRPAPGTDWEHVVRTFDATARAGYNNISLKSNEG